MAVKRNRIGLLISSIHKGFCLHAWESFVHTAAKEKTSLFIFPGGGLHDRQDYEYLRNPVYDLVNTENLDGCISWSTTIRHSLSKEEYNHFLSKFVPLPIVTIGFSTPPYPCIDYDNYNGMKALVTHCIQVHGARKIAFLRGPDSSSVSQSRYDGYCDALLDAGIIKGTSGKKNTDYLDTLVTGSFSLDEGGRAAAQLLEERSLVPGRDFDTLVGTSDLMALGAMNYFSQRGYHVPADYHVIGFSDSMESRIAECPLSTVRVPTSELAGESFKILRNIIGRKKHGDDSSIRLNCEVIIRESCGCTGFKNTWFKELPDIKTGAKSALEKNLFVVTRDYLKFDSAEMNSLAHKIIHSLLHDDKEVFSALFENALTGYFTSGGEPENLLRLISDLRTAQFDFPEQLRGIEPYIYQSILRIRENLRFRLNYERVRRNTILNSLKCDLLGTRDRVSLIRSLAGHLGDIGITTAAVILYSDEKTSLFVGGFTKDGILPLKDLYFPATLMVPAGIVKKFSTGIFLVQPLFIENQPLGYFVHNVPMNDGLLFEELRSTISYTLKGIFLLEETIRAKRIAEQAERAKTDFFQALENSLYYPLHGIMDRLEALETIKSTRFSEMLNGLQELKAFVAARESETGSLINFSLAKIDELELKKTVFYPEDLLPNIGVFPLLIGDTAHLAQCFALIREQYNCTGYSAELSYTGLVITFRGSYESGTDTQSERHFNLLLAERIVLMHGGDLSLETDHCRLTLPWPTITGQEPAKYPMSSRDEILVLSDPAFLPKDLAHLHQVRDSAAITSNRVAFIAWNASDAHPDDLVRIAGLRWKDALSDIPFLCYGMAIDTSGPFDSAGSLLSAIEHAIKSPKNGIILVIGPHDPSIIPGMYEIIHIDTMSSFKTTIDVITPLLIIFTVLDPDAAAIVRQHPLTAMVPVLVVSSHIDTTRDVLALSQYSRLLICHTAVVTSPEFQARIQAVINGDEILPSHTGILVKKAILHFGQNAQTHISRLKLANAVNVNEDYLTRIFHKEMGLSLWDYLNRLRVFRAAVLLRETDNTIRNIALLSGFQNQTYFCRVFKKIYGLSPGQLRRQQYPED